MAGDFRDGITDSVAEEDQSTQELLPGLQAASVQSQIALGERRVRRLGQLQAQLHLLLI